LLNSDLMTISKIANWGAVLLMGGKGQRMGGRDKSRLVLNGQSFQEIALAFVTDHFDHIAISVGPKEIPERGFPQLIDRQMEGQSIGPAGGLLAALDWARGLGLEGFLTLPVDTPILPDDIAARLCDSGSSAYASHQNQNHWLHAAWRVSDYEKIETAVIRDDVYSLYRLHKIIGSEPIEFADGTPGNFQNINSPEDYQAILDA